jgi:hypothetical protein
MFALTFKRMMDEHKITTVCRSIVYNDVASLIAEYAAEHGPTCFETCGVYDDDTMMFTTMRLANEVIIGDHLVSDGQHYRVFHSAKCPTAPGHCLFCGLYQKHTAACPWWEAITCATPERCHLHGSHTCSAKYMPVLSKRRAAWTNLTMMIKKSRMIVRHSLCLAAATVLMSLFTVTWIRKESLKPGFREFRLGELLMPMTLAYAGCMIATRHL